MCPWRKPRRLGSESSLGPEPAWEDSRKTGEPQVSCRTTKPSAVLKTDLDCSVPVGKPIPRPQPSALPAARLSLKDTGRTWRSGAETRLPGTHVGLAEC